MVVVLVAGGTGGLGRTIAEEILACRKHTLFILSRSTPDASASLSGVTTLVVDYSNPQEIAGILQQNQIDTVISCLAANTEEANAAQLNLIDGAARSSTVRRFAPSEFGLDYLEAARQNFPFYGTALKVAAIEKLRTYPSMEYTRFITSIFMDYVGPPNAPSNMPLASLVVDFENCRASIPGDGNTPVIFTHTRDIGRFVAASLDLETWHETSLIVGDRISTNELVALAEEAKGRKFDITYDSVEDLKGGKSTELSINIPRYAFLPKAMIDSVSQTVGVAMATGWADIKLEALNDRLPEVEAMHAVIVRKDCFMTSDLMPAVFL